MQSITDTLNQNIFAEEFSAIYTKNRKKNKAHQIFTSDIP